MLLPLALLVGVTLALAGRQLDDGIRWRHPAHASAWLLGLGLFTPLSAYLLWRYPDWALMYTIDSGGLGPMARLALIATTPIAAGLGCLLTLFLQGRLPLVTYAVLGLAAATLVGIGTWGWDRLVRVGSFGTYHEGTQSLMPVLLDSRLGVVLLFALPALGGVWGYALLMLHRRPDALEG